MRNSRAMGLAMVGMLCWAMAARQVPAQAVAERVGGRVVSDVDGHAMGHVLMSLTSSKTNETIASTTSDAEGHFQFEPVAAGKYQLMGTAKHYLPSYYLQHDLYWTAIVTGAGLATGELELRMNPAATIAGRVVDDDGAAVDHAVVHLYREDTTSSKRVTRIAVAPCNEDGEYEFTGLARGRYYLAAIGEPWYAAHPPMETEGEKVPYRAAIDPALDVVYPMEFYADAQESDKASALKIEGGEQITANLEMHLQHALTLTIMQPAGDRHPLQAMLMRSVFGSLEAVNTRGESTETVDRIDGIPPGQYVVQETVSGSSTPMRAEGVDLSSASANMELMKLGELATVRVTLLAADGAALLENTQLGLLGQDGRRVNSNGMSAKDSVTFANVPAGDYAFEVFGGGRQLGVVGVSVAGKTVAEKRLHVGDGGSVAVDVLVSTVEVEVNGFVHRGDEAGPASMVVLVPAGADTSEELFRRDQSDLDGSFVFHNVLPGNYIVVAIDEGWPLRWTDTAVLAPYLMHGLPVTIGSGSRPVVQLPRPVPAQLVTQSK